MNMELETIQSLNRVINITENQISSRKKAIKKIKDDLRILKLTRKFVKGALYTRIK